jgi:hypothetical protein
MKILKKIIFDSTGIYTQLWAWQAGALPLEPQLPLCIIYFSYVLFAWAGLKP